MKGGIQVLFSPLFSFAVLCIFWLLHTAGRGLPVGCHWSGCPAQPLQAAGGAGPCQGAVSAPSGDSSAGEKPGGRQCASLSAGTTTPWPALSSQSDHCHPHHVHVEDVTLGTRFLLCEDRAVPLPCPHTEWGQDCHGAAAVCHTGVWMGTASCCIPIMALSQATRGCFFIQCL